MIGDKSIRVVTAKARNKVARVSGCPPNAVTAKARNKVARVSECPPTTATTAIIIDLANIPDEINDMIVGDANRRYSRLCRLITLDMVLSRDATPRSVIGNAAHAQFCLRKRWRANRQRLPEDSGDGIYSWSFDETKETAVQDGCRVAVTHGIYRPQILNDRLGISQEGYYHDDPEADLRRIGAASAIEDQRRWGEIRVHWVEELVPTEGAYCRGYFTTLVCVITWGGGARIVLRVR